MPLCLKCQEREVEDYHNARNPAKLCLECKCRPKRMKGIYLVTCKYININPTCERYVERSKNYGEVTCFTCKKINKEKRRVDKLLDKKG